jgi:hypothetical protein
MRVARRFWFLPTFVLACQGEIDGAGSDLTSFATERVDPDRLLADEAVEGGAEVTVAELASFLSEEGSALAGFVEGGRSAAQWIVNEGRDAGISPIYLLARIEGESGLISSGTLANLRAATGCGCPDGQACDPRFANFGLQVRCAARKLRGYLDDLDARGATISGWAVGHAKRTLDPCVVVPATRATAALYTYTPWVGAYGAGCGTFQWGGASLMAVLTRRYAAALAARCPFGDGLYCGANGVAGDPTTLYQCAGGRLTVLDSCTAGCVAEPPGTDDHCR